MFTIPKSLSYVLAGSILVATAGCERETPSVIAPGSSESTTFAKKPPAPKGPLNLRSTGNTSYSVSFAWDASTGAASYRIRDNFAREISVPGTQTSVTWKYPAHPWLQPGSTYSFSAYAVDAAGNKSANSNTVSVSLPADNTPPTAPTLTATSVGTGYVTLAWSSTDDSPFISYQVKKDGVPITDGGLTWVSATSKTFTLLEPGTAYTFTAQSRDSYVNVSTGNLSAVSTLTVTTLVDDGSDVTPPTQPTNVQAFGYGDLEMQVWWGASTDNVTPQNVIVYEIYVNGVHENTAIGTNMTPSAYGVAGENVVTVIAIDEAGNPSTAGTTTIFLP
ncbi:MAG TPA: hypothetical protein VF128_09860 [Gemmatimonadaceae bacterium]